MGLISKNVYHLWFIGFKALLFQFQARRRHMIPCTNSYKRYAFYFVDGRSVIVWLVAPAARV